MKTFFRYVVLVIGSFFFKNRQSKVLFYHDIHKKDRYTTMSTSLELFKEHIYTIRNKSFEIVSEITKKDNQIKLQFDDGYKGIYDCLNFLINKKIPVEIFIVTSQIGKDNFLNKKQILELFDSGLVTISSHTHSHCNLSSIRREDLSNELILSKSILEGITGTSINSICYPFGKFSKQVINECYNANYLKQYSSLAGSYFDNPIPNVYRRNLVQFASCKELNLILKGANSIFNKLYFKKHFSK